MKRCKRILAVALVAALAPSLLIGQGREFIGEGMGIGGVLVGVSTKDQIIAEFGRDYEVVTHKEYSTEIVYKEKGVSFYFCQSDPNQEVFAIDLESPFAGMTSKGVVLGESTRDEVKRSYRRRPDEAPGEISFGHIIGTGDDSFEGIGFTYGYVPDRPEKEVVVEIEIIEKAGLRQCHVKFPKSEDK